MKRKAVMTRPLGTKSTVLWAEEMDAMSRRVTDSYGLAPERSVSHRLTVDRPDGRYGCDCGVAYPDIIDLEWHQHRGGRNG